MLERACPCWVAQARSTQKFGAACGEGAEAQAIGRTVDPGHALVSAQLDGDNGGGLDASFRFPIINRSVRAARNRPKARPDLLSSYLGSSEQANVGHDSTQPTRRRPTADGGHRQPHAVFLLVA